MKAFLIGVTAAKLTSKDVRNSFQDTKHGISSYMTDVFDSQGDMSKDFDEFTRYGSMLEPGGSNGKIKEKLYPEVIKLFKKLNIRAVINGMGPMDQTIFDEGRYGLFADAMKDYGCWCLPNQGALDNHGAPIDELDRICHEFNTCRTCLEYDQCKLDETTYGWQVVEKKKNKNIYCTDKSGSCGRNLCECEVHMIQQLLDNAHLYNPIYAHANGFDRSLHCGKHAVPVISSEVETTTYFETTTEQPTTDQPTTELKTTEAVTTTATTTIAEEKTTTEISTTSATTSKMPQVIRTESARGKMQDDLNRLDDLVKVDEDDFEVEENNNSKLNGGTFEKILVADYPSDPLVQPGATQNWQKTEKLTDQGLPEEPIKIDTPINHRRQLPVKLVAPVMLKSAVQKQKNFAPKIFQEPSKPQCCGEYPHVSIFNPDRRKCCHGVIRSFGSC